MLNLNYNKIKKVSIKSAKPLINSLPILIGVILLVSLTNSILPKTAFASLFNGNSILDSFIGSSIGSVLAGNPVTSYILGGELQSQGISLLAITAFLVAWVTVGIIQLPAESILLGKKFSITRNITAFIFSMIVAGLVIIILNITGGLIWPLKKVTLIGIFY